MTAMKTSNVTQIRTADQHLDNAWKTVKSCLTTVLVLNDVNGKSLQRANQDIRKALFDLFSAIEIYDQLKEEK